MLDLLTLDELFHSLSFFLYINLCLFFSSVVASFLSLFLSLSQFWLFSKTGEIRRDEACLDYAGTDVILYPCHGAKGNQYWEYDPTVYSLHYLHEVIPITQIGISFAIENPASNFNIPKFHNLIF